MTQIEKFTQEHRALIFKYAHTPKEAVDIAALVVWYILSFLYGAMHSERPDRFADRLEQDCKGLKEILEMISIPHICPHCGLMSDWDMIPMQNILDAAWIIAITKTASQYDHWGYLPSSLQDIEAAIIGGCRIYIEFFCIDCCYEENAYLRGGKIEPIPIGPID